MKTYGGNKGFKGEMKVYAQNDALGPKQRLATETKAYDWNEDLWQK